MYTLRFIVLLLAVYLNAASGSTMYDGMIKEATEKHLPGVDWRLYKAQLIAESQLNPNALSPVGASGIAQFMPRTWAQMVRELQLPATAKATDPQYAIPAGAYYMSKKLRGWSAPRPEADRYCLALASYNAGFGNMLKAQRVAGGVSDYASIARALPQVTGKHSRETITYVRRILRTCSTLVTRG